MDTNRLCINQTPMKVRCIPMLDRQGGDVLVVIAKLTWEVCRTGGAKVPLQPSPVRLADTSVSAGRWSSVRYPSDHCADKPGTDVLLVGTAQPPHPSATTMTVAIRVAARNRLLEKSAIVYGPRVWCRSATAIAPGPPAALVPTPLVYERTFGGVDDSDGRELLVDWRNPAGTGVARDRASLLGTRTPEIEDPRAPLGANAPAPAGFGPILPYWQPRAALAGTRDETWRRERAPIPPIDCHPRYASCASPGLWSESPLQGDEAVEVLGATDFGPWRFRLPRYAPLFKAVTRGISKIADTHLDTFLVDADAGRVELTWRARVPIPRPSSRLEAVYVWSRDPLPAMAHG